MTPATLATTEPQYTPDDTSVPEFVSDKIRPDIVAGLLKEYTEKLRRLVGDVSDYVAASTNSHGVQLLQALRGPATTPAGRAQEAAAREVRRQLIRLVPASTELARLASAQIEHTRIRPYERVELMLRASEFEAALESASEALKALPR